MNRSRSSGSAAAFRPAEMVPTRSGRRCKRAATAVARCSRIDGISRPITILHRAFRQDVYPPQRFPGACRRLRSPAVPHRSARRDRHRPAAAAAARGQLEALEHAGLAVDRLAGSRTGIFLGISTNDYSNLLNRSAFSSARNASAGAGNAASIASGRLSYTFGFEGPCMAIDTACSSSLVALHVAVQSLRNRECNLALIAGVNLMLTPDITINFCQGRMLRRTDVARPSMPTPTAMCAAKVAGSSW